MSIEQPIVEVYFDDAGNTGNKADPIQTNLLLGAVVVPCDRADRFWQDIGRAWTHAAAVCGQPEHSLELKGSALYTGRGDFQGVALVDRRRVIELFLEAIVSHRITFFWQGVPKHLWHAELAARALDPKDVPLWTGSLFSFCVLLHKLLDMLYEGGEFSIVGDQNSWIDEGYRMIPPAQASWPRFAGRGVAFQSSRQVRGLQVADLLVHTAYRANKESCPPPGSTIQFSEMDRIADNYWQGLVAEKLAFDLLSAVQQLQAKRGDSPDSLEA